MIHSFLLRENVLTDNLLHVPTKGHLYKGGYIAQVVEFTPLNEWSDKKEVKRFRSKERLLSYLYKTYPDAMADIDLTGTCIE